MTSLYSVSNAPSHLINAIYGCRIVLCILLRSDLRRQVSPVKTQIYGHVGVVHPVQYALIWLKRGNVMNGGQVTQKRSIYRPLNKKSKYKRSSSGRGWVV